MVHHPEFTVGFHRVEQKEHWISYLAFFFHSGQSNRTHWFMFDGGTARYIGLSPVGDVLAKGWTVPAVAGTSKPLDEPIDGMDYLAGPAKWGFQTDTPMLGDRRPGYILLPDLPEIMAHSAKPPETVPVDIFRYYRCVARGDAGL